MNYLFYVRSIITSPISLLFEVSVSYLQGRARHSIKRRPPSRRHRKSSGDDVGPEEEKIVLPVSECAAPDGNEEDVFEMKKVEEKNVNSAESASFTSEQQKEQNQSASTDSELQPTTESEKQSKAHKEALVCAENEEKLEEEEKMPGEPQLDNSTSESTKHEEPHEDPATEPQSELDRVTEGKEGQEKEEKAKDSQTEVRIHIFDNPCSWYSLGLFSIELVNLTIIMGPSMQCGESLLF